MMGTERKIIRTFQNNVFCKLFESEEYRFELYRTLHPEDKETQSRDIKLATLDPILYSNLCNDLCLQAKDRFLIFVEAQSTFCPGIAFRMFLYAAHTYFEFIIEHEMDIFHEDFVLPDAEFYVVYNGEGRIVPEKMNLSDIIKGIDMEVKVLLGKNQKDQNIVYQYYRFCKVVKNKLRRYPNDHKRAIKEAIKQCIQEGILVEFLRKRSKEIIEIMDFLFNQELATKFREKRIAREAEARGVARGEAIGEVRGEAKGIAKNQKDVATRMIKMAEFSLEQISQISGLTLTQLNKLKAELQ